MKKESLKIASFALAVSVLFTVASQASQNRRIAAIIPEKVNMEVSKEEENKKFPKLKKHL